MANSDESKKDLDEQTNNVLAAAVVAALLAAAIAIGFYISQFSSNDLSTEVEKWGQFGDYFGGVINPVVGLITVFLVVMSISIQRKELRASIEEMKAANIAAQKMSFEQSLFAWLENYHSQIREIELDNRRGRKVLLDFYTLRLSPEKTVLLSGFYKSLSPRVLNRTRSNEIFMQINPHANLDNEMAEVLFNAILKYTALYLAHRTDLDAPFRTLFRLLRWIDSSIYSNEEKWHYCTLVRSQLSWPELVFLYYNCLIREGEKLAPYANKYALFDNLLTDDELIRFATQELTNCPADQRPRTRDGDAPWPFTPSAFDSTKAKKDLGLPDAA